MVDFAIGFLASVTLHVIVLRPMLFYLLDRQEQLRRVKRIEHYRRLELERLRGIARKRALVADVCRQVGDLGSGSETCRAGWIASFRKIAGEPASPWGRA